MPTSPNQIINLPTRFPDALIRNLDMTKLAFGRPCRLVQLLHRVLVTPPATQVESLGCLWHLAAVFHLLHLVAVAVRADLEWLARLVGVMTGFATVGPQCRMQRVIEGNHAHLRRVLLHRVLFGDRVHGCHRPEREGKQAENDDDQDTHNTAPISQTNQNARCRLLAILGAGQLLRY